MHCKKSGASEKCAGASLMLTTTIESVLLVKQMVPVLLQGDAGVSLLLQEIMNSMKKPQIVVVLMIFMGM